MMKMRDKCQARKKRHASVGWGASARQVQSVDEPKTATWILESDGKQQATRGYVCLTIMSSQVILPGFER